MSPGEREAEDKKLESFERCAKRWDAHILDGDGQGFYGKLDRAVILELVEWVRHLRLALAEPAEGRAPAIQEFAESVEVAQRSLGRIEHTFKRLDQEGKISAATWESVGMDIGAIGDALDEAERVVKLPCIATDERMLALIVLRPGGEARETPILATGYAILAPDDCGVMVRPRDGSLCIYSFPVEAEQEAKHCKNVRVARVEIRPAAPEGREEKAHD